MIIFAPPKGLCLQNPFLRIFQWYINFWTVLPNWGQRERELFNANILLKLQTYRIIILHVDNSCMIKFCPLWSVSYPLMTRDGMLQFTVGLPLKVPPQSDAMGLQADHQLQPWWVPDVFGEAALQCTHPI